MLNNFNLITTTYRYRESYAIDEMLDLLAELGDDNASFDVTNISGLVTGITSLDPLRVIEEFKEMIRSENWRFRYVLRVLPVESVTNSNLSEILVAALNLSKKKLPKSDSFMVNVEKRHNSSLRSLDLKHGIAKEINNPVDLETPKWIILIEVLGNLTGIAVLQKDQIFSSVLEKRDN